MTQVNIEIDRFSGPLALLLHLIRQEEMDIFDININQITKQYLESIKQMKKLNLEGAGEFIAMAATLIQIKSKMLLPQYNEQGEIIEQEDPRKDLVRRLLEYQMYQEAGQKLYKAPLLNRDVWARGDKEKIEVPESDIVLEEGNALYSLIAAYRVAVKNMKKAVHKVAKTLQSISDRIWEMRERLIVGQQVRFSELATIGVPAMSDSISAEDLEKRRGTLLITFLSLLEMAKIGIVSLFQADSSSDIHVDTLKQIDRDMISNVENYEAANNLGGVTEITVDEVDIKEANEAEAAEATALGSENAAQMSFDETAGDDVTTTGGAGAESAGPPVIAGTPAADQLLEEEAATDEEILAEEMRLLASENDSWSEFTEGNVQGISDGEKIEEVEA